MAYGRVTNRIALARAAVLLALLLPAGAARAHPAHGIAVDSSGAVWFVDLRRETVWRLSGDRLEAMATRLHAHRLMPDGDTHVLVDHQEWAPSLGTSRMSYYRLDTDGRREELVAPTPMPRPAPGRPVIDDFASGLGMLRDADRRSYSVVYVQDEAFPRLVRRDPATPVGVDEVLAERIHELVGGEARAPDLKVVQAMAWDREGAILLTEGGRLRRLHLDGRLVTLGGEPLAGVAGSHVTIPVADRTLGVADDDRGRIFVADYGRGAVRRVDPDGSVTTVMRSRPTWGPTGVAVDGDDLYVLEARRGVLSPALRWLDGPRVLVVRADGSRTTLVNVDAHRRFYPWIALMLVAGVIVAIVRIRRRRRIRAAASLIR